MELLEEQHDKAAEAREARRRRILENSNKRLVKITGRDHNEGKHKFHFLILFKFSFNFGRTLVTFVGIPEPIVNNGIYPDPDMERDIYEAPTIAGMDPETQDIFELLKTMQGGSAAFAQSPQQPQAPPVPQTPFSKFIRSKIPIVLIALIVYMLFALDLDFVVGGSVFSSLIAWEVFEFVVTSFVIKEPVQQGGILNILFAFGGFSQQRTQMILKLLGLFNKIIRDIAIFMVIFVTIHLAWSFLVVGESLSQILDKDFSNLLKNDEL